ncbi:unnamed protein product [Psylliodes chrysocephalus]|uniref:FAM234A/B beta-propeller domain-containing protein n=1 Tax=Psylliodes chrysocephalus TaxID=3402493 RepID=A0A9P0G4B8_9CUCU|nr:unnamed protein product [Psylliodes chrysocephala]
MSHSSQGVYIPLPQSLSDSDSEKEEKSNYISNGVNSSKIKFSQPKNGHTQMHEYEDNIGKIKNLNRKLSTRRRAALVFSIFLCFLPIVVFLWILPCQDTNTCSLKIGNWESIHENLELMGPINLVRGIFHKNWNLALIYKGSYSNPKSFKNGVISLLGNNGAVAWDFQQQSYPHEINCTTIDVESNGYYDCLVVDSRGLKVIETISGEALWHAHSIEQKSIPELEMPIKIEDFDNDGTNELLAVYKKSDLLIISGKTGQALSNIKLPSICSSIKLLKTGNLNSIKYICSKTEGIKATYETSMSDIKSYYLNSGANIKLNVVENEDNSTFYQAGDKKLIIENLNICPICQSVVTLYSSNNTKLHLWKFDNAVVMNPIPFTFPSSRPLYSFETYIHGFILKMWYWQDNSLKLSPVTRIYKRNVPVHNETFHLNKVSERIILIILKENDVQIENVSLTDIYLICNGPQHNNCQPDFNNQKDSLLIADLDFDNSLELISYSSSYKKIDINGDDTWHLTSKINVFRLESEFPKLLEIK